MRQSKKDNLVVPNSISFKYIKKALFTLYSAGQITREKLSKDIEYSKSVISNILPILNELRVVKRRGPKGRYIELTDNGRKIVEYLKEGNKSKVVYIFEILLDNSKTLKEAYEIIKASPEITPYQLGTKIADKFNREWKNRRTYQSVGRSCFEIFSGFGLIDREKYRSEQGIEGRKKVFPTITVDKIFELTKKMDKKYPLPAFLPYDKEGQKTRRRAEFKVLNDLGIIKKVDKQKYILTIIGERLKNELGKPNESTVFRQILLSNEPVLEIVNKLGKIEGDFNWQDVGNILQDYNKSKWNERTRKWYGTKFLSWLKKAGFIEQNNEFGHYRIVPKFSSLVIQTKLPISDERIIKISNETESIKNTEKVPITGAMGLNGNIRYIECVLFRTLAFKKLPEDRKELDEAISHLKSQDKENGLLIESIGMLINNAYRHNDIEPIRDASKLWLELRKSYTQ